ncbi:MAG TPA: hypothetical protein DCG75_02035 [Bacteroidales bacterium]|nr:hypothetical protein [Bacteroidales bacterium]
MRTSLNFEDKSTKELISKLNFEFFLNQNIDKENYSKESISDIEKEFEICQRELKNKSKANRNQFYFYAEGQVRKMFIGGFLPALFELDESRSHTITDFKAVGESWAYFQYWSDKYRKKLRKEKLWVNFVRVGSILAFILTALKLYEILTKP